MVLPPSKPLATIRRCFSNQSACVRIHSGATHIFSCCVRPTATSCWQSPTEPISDNKPNGFLTPVWKKNLGSEWNKSNASWISQTILLGPWDSRRTAKGVHRDHTSVRWEGRTAKGGTSVNLCCTTPWTRDWLFQARMLKWWLGSGKSKWAQCWAWTWGTNSGSRGTSCSEWPNTSTSRWTWGPNLLRATGTGQAVTPTSPTNPLGTIQTWLISRNN